MVSGHTPSGVYTLQMLLLSKVSAVVCFLSFALVSSRYHMCYVIIIVPNDLKRSFRPQYIKTHVFSHLHLVVSCQKDDLGFMWTGLFN